MLIRTLNGDNALVLQFSIIIKMNECFFILSISCCVLMISNPYILVRIYWGQSAVVFCASELILFFFCVCYEVIETDAFDRICMIFHIVSAEIRDTCTHHQGQDCSAQ